MTTPTDIPVNGDGTFDDPTWGESGTFSTSAYEGSGIPAGALIGKNDFNTSRRHFGRWLRAIRDRMVFSDDGLYTTCLLKAGAWNTGGATLDGTLGPSRMIIDADDNGGVMVEVTIPAGSPHTFSASRDTYVNVNEDGQIEYQAVSLGAAAPTPSAGYVAVWKVVTDGTELVSADPVVVGLPLLANIGIQRLTVIEDLTVAEDLAVTGTSTLGGAVTCSTTLGVTGASTFTGTLTASNNSVLGSDSGDTCTINGTITANQLATFNANVVLGDAGDKSLTVNASSTFQAGVECNGNVFFNANVTIGDAAADTCTINATSAVNAPVTITTTTDTDFGLDIVPKSASPDFAPLRLGSQFADPTSSVLGQISSSGARGVLRYFSPTLAAWQSLHQSPKGLVDNWAAGTSGTILNSGDIASVVVLAEEVGTVLIEATGLFQMASGTNFDLVIRDVTADVTVATAVVYVTATGETTTQSLRAVYTLPGAGLNRTFAMQVNGNGGSQVTRSNCVLSVRGVR